MLLRLRAVCASRVWPLALLLTAVAAAALFSSAPGRLISDGQLELYWSPGRVLARQAAAWDPGRGLGAVRTEFWPVPAAVLGVLRLVGASAVAAERLWHLGLLLAGGLGMIAVLRLRRPRIGVEHVVAALLYLFNPFTAVLLTPWPLFIGYALAPWFVVAFVRGVTGERPWRWAAVLALLVFVPGALNMVAVLYAALPLLAAAVYLVHVERVSDWRRVAGWVGRAVVLSLAVSLAALVASRTGGTAIAEHVPATPPVETVNRFSSWTESWRGLGYWRTEAQQPGYVDSWPLLLASFAAPAAALASLWLVRARLRLLFGTVMVLGALVMVGTHPVSDPPPFGRALRSTFDALPAIARLRATYLAGPTVLLGMAGLVGLAVAAATAHLRHRRHRVAAAPAAVAVAVIGLAAFPFWTGDIYAEVDRSPTVPDHWRSALAWLDGQPGDGRVLVLPSGGDVVDAVLRRPHIQPGDGDRFEGTPLSADLLDALDEHVTSSSYRPGTLAPIARRLGIRFVLVDAGIGSTTPSARLRSDADLRLAATFGKSGDRSSLLEVYELDGVGGIVRADPPVEPLLVSGDGSAWPVLAAEGRLQGDRPVRYTAGATPGELAAALQRGAPLVVTDTDTDAGPEGTTATVDHDGATITESGVTDPDGERPGRPAAAFDGNRSTAWLVGTVPEAAVLRVDLPSPVDVSEVTIVRTTGAPRIATVTLRFSEGDDVTFDLVRPETTVRLPPREAAWFEVRVDGVTGAGPSPLGIAEIALGGIELREEIELPDDVIRAADVRPQLRQLLADADLTYLVTARDRQGARLHRRFRTVGRRAYSVSGVVRLTADTPDAVLWSGVAGVCHGGIIRVDGVDLPVRLDPGEGGLAPGAPARFEACAPLTIGAGFHRLDTEPTVLVERAVLRSPAVAAPEEEVPAAAPSLEVLEQTATRLRLVVDAPAGTHITIGQSFHEGWRATLDGRSLGPPLPLDTLAGWRIPESGQHHIDISFAPQRRHDLALLLTLAAVAGCAWLAGHRSRR